MAQSATPVALCWSGGKDSSLTLQALVHGGYSVATLVTTVTAGYERISMHGVRRQLLLAQAESLGLPVHEVRIPAEATNVQYEAAMLEALEQLGRAGIRMMAFGDIFLSDIRAYRERLLQRAGWQALFPIWQRSSEGLAEAFLAAGFRAILVCVDLQILDARFAGRWYDRKLLADLPPGVDRCGENGEFHTFVYDGPLFRCPVRFQRGAVVRRDRWAFCDLVPAEPSGASPQAAAAPEGDTQARGLSFESAIHVAGHGCRPS
ncbi:MAG: ATP-binding protein [Gemmataceae bacterium]